MMHAPAYALPENLKPGMVLLENDGRKQVPVRSVVVAPVGCRHKVHVNSNACYDAGVPVEVKE